MRVTRTKIRTEIHKNNWFLYGPPGIGKTTLASKFPRSLFIYTEMGHGFVTSDCLQTKNNEKMFASFKDIQDGVEDLTKDHNYRDHYDVIWIDTVDNFVDMAFRYFCLTHRVEHVSDAQWGKGWDLTGDLIKTIIYKLQSVGFMIGFISHEFSKDHSYKDRKVTRILPSLGTTARKIILPFADFIGYMYMHPAQKEGKRVHKRAISFLPHSEYESKDRSGRFDKVIFLDNPETCYSKLEEVWNSETVTTEDISNA